MCRSNKGYLKEEKSRGGNPQKPENTKVKPNIVAVCVKDSGVMRHMSTHTATIKEIKQI